MRVLEVVPRQRPLQMEQSSDLVSAWILNKFSLFSYKGQQNNSSSVSENTETLLHYASLNVCSWQIIKKGAPSQVESSPRSTQTTPTFPSHSSLNRLEAASHRVQTLSVPTSRRWWILQRQFASATSSDNKMVAGAPVPAFSKDQLNHVDSLVAKRLATISVECVRRQLSPTRELYHQTLNRFKTIRLE